MNHTSNGAWLPDATPGLWSERTDLVVNNTTSTTTTPEVTVVVSGNDIDYTAHFEQIQKQLNLTNIFLLLLVVFLVFRRMTMQIGKNFAGERSVDGE